MNNADTKRARGTVSTRSITRVVDTACNRGTTRVGGAACKGCTVSTRSIACAGGTACTMGATRGRNTARLIFAAAVLFAAVMLTSCVDIIKAYSYKDGKYTVYAKVTLSKVMFQLAQMDANAWVDELLSNDTDNVAQRIETDAEAGAQWRKVISAKTRDSEEKKMLPTVSGNRVFIPLFDEDIPSLPADDSDEGKLALAFLSSVKCRVLVSKNIVPSVDKVYIEGNGGQDYAVAFFDYGECWGFELPLITLFNNPQYNFKRIVVISK